MPTTPSSLQVVKEIEVSTIGDQAPTPAVGSLEMFANQNGTFYSKNSSGIVIPLIQGVTSIGGQTGVLTATQVQTVLNATNPKPKDTEGVLFIDTANTAGWTGSDIGAWINAAYAYGKTTYGATNGVIIKIAPGAYTQTTPIVMETQFFSFILEGSGDGGGGTNITYTPTTGIAMNIGGAGSNLGGVQIRDFSLFGPGIGTAAVGIKWGLLGASSTAGATASNVSVWGFGTGETWETNTNIAYAVTHINCKVQFCATGVKPFGEANNWFGGLIGNCTTGLDGSNNGTDAEFFGTAFDDNTTVAVNISQPLFRSTFTGCRWENAGLGTDLYFTQTNGSIIILGGTIQSDIVAVGTSTGFGNLSGGNFRLDNTWLLGQGSRVFTQAFNCSSSVIARINPIIAPSSVGITTIQQIGFTDKGILNQLTGNVAVPVTTETLVMNARYPANACVVGQVFRFKAVTILTGADACTWRIRTGTAGTVADATVTNIVAGVAGAANGRSIYEGLITVRTIGGAGTAEGEGTAITSSTVASTTAAAPATTALITNAAFFLDITLSTTIGASTVVQAYIEAL